MSDYKYSFEKLEVWQDARQFVVRLYRLTKTFPADEKFILCSQIQRAGISIVSNIAEGTSRNSSNEKIRFLEIAYGSLMEVYNQLIISFDLHYISEEELAVVKIEIDKISNKLNALKRSFTK